MPEVDKLVALSRLFHLPVGVLLGVEEAAAAEPPRPVVPRWKRRLWPLLSAALGAVCVVLVLRAVSSTHLTSERSRLRGREGCAVCADEKEG